ncbi:SDR family NAD(P)-dependent oxidoreductase [Neobacillus drentensis]|uniref:SDR family NAD(P)-dependent oxidoreductase n=1 Tax=Neobacillus drentensis TaxID=220684 RepID=UPI0009ECEFE8|nr:SDR family NAD(P)-dependent oxidoreductase [Neobacillus drentensis]
MFLQDQVAIVTGAGNGIGKATAIGLAKQGAKVIVNDINEEHIAETVQIIRSQNGEAIGVQGNVALYEDTQRIVDAARETFGTVHILVNNAGIIRPAMIHKMDDDQWNQVIDVSLKGTFNCIKAVAPIFIERGKENPEALSNGKIINVTSTAGLGGTIGQVNYSAAKAGVIGVTMSTAREWGRYRVQSNAVAFGVVETDMTETIRSDKFADTYKNKIVLNRFAAVDDVVPGIVFLASSGSNYITGHVLNISGGSHIG